MEAEFVAFANAVQKTGWLKRFCNIWESQIVTRANEPMTINCDNRATIFYTKDLKYHGETKHIDIKYNYVKDIIS